PNEFLSKRWHEYTGLSPEESHGWGWQAAFHPEDLPPLMERWVKMLTSGVPDEIEARLRRHDGVYRWFLIRAEPFRDESGQIVRWYGTSTDIEDRKRAEAALESRGNDLKLIIDTIPTLSWSTDPTGFVEFLSRPWMDFTGLSEEQALGFGWSIAIHPDDAPGLLRYWKAALDSGTRVDVEARIRRFDGVYRWFLFRANPLRDHTGAIIKWYGTNIDIEDRKRAEDDLNKARSDLAHISRVTSLAALTASIAHEVNQPLSGIFTNAGTCLRMLDADPPNINGARETARRTIRDSKRASEVVGRLRALFTRGEFTPESMDLNEAAREVINLSMSDLQRDRVSVQTDL